MSDLSALLYIFCLPDNPTNVAEKWISICLSLFYCYEKIMKILGLWNMTLGTTRSHVLGPWSLIFGTKINHCFRESTVYCVDSLIT